VVIEGVKMMTCFKCAELGSEEWREEPKSQQQLPMLQPQARFKNSSLKRKSPIMVPEEIAVVEGFGSLVRRAREDQGLSHEILGRRISERISVIRKVETERMIPDQRLAGKLEHALGIKLLAPLTEPKVPSTYSSTSRGVTLGEIVQLKDARRSRRKNESNHR
jgi:putative transcription factor